jgi:DNA polymerase
MSREHPDPADPAQQLRQYIDSCRAAGIEWVPQAPLPEVVPATPSPAAGPSATPPPLVLQTSLFAAAPADTAERGQPDEERRRHELTVLSEQVAGCRRCAELWSTRTQTVFGVGPLNPDLCFVGEAPGADEDRTGEPFVGAAGQLLNRIITACGLRREEVYILNILKCRPPGNRQPKPDEADHCRDYLEKQIELIGPKFMCALGGSAVKYLLGTQVGITRLRGRFLEYRGIQVMCTFHPSYLLRTPEAKKDVWEDMKKLLTRMGRPIPGKSG